MKKLCIVLVKNFILFYLIFLITGNLYCQPIIADHTFVDKYSLIPQQYIDSVKKRWLSYAGESHSEAIRVGLTALEDSNSVYQVNVTESGTPEGITSDHLRVSRATWGSFGSGSGWIYTYGEEDWFTNATALSRTKAGITYCNQNGFPLDYFAFGWCWDPTATNEPGGTVDPVWGVRWAGCTVNGTDGNKRWGLDSGDSVITDNRINTDSYINATVEYILHCVTNGYPTKVLFTTGPIDNYSSWASGESGYQQYLKYEHIRNFVRNSNYSMFDYADILSYNNAGEQQTTTWTDNNGDLQTFPIIHPENMEGGSIAHIGMNGAIKLAKAMWVLLAIEEGWDYSSQIEDTEAPTKPSNVKAISIGNKSIILSWNPSTDNIAVTGYQIYRDDTPVGTSLITNYNDTGLSVETTYTYKISAYDAKGNMSLPSEPFIVKTLLVKTLYPSAAGSGLVIFPNPVTNYFSIELPENEAIFQYEIYSLSGKLITCKTVDSMDNKITFHLDLANGMYLVKIYNNKHSYIAKFCVEK